MSFPSNKSTVCLDEGSNARKIDRLGTSGEKANKRIHTSFPRSFLVAARIKLKRTSFAQTKGEGIETDGEQEQ